jgi:hypothetical protein
VQKPILTEDDVLHVKQLPDFDGHLRARECELLLQYLTAPYMRIPLVIHFFADQVRINALSNVQLQGVVDAVVFEPSLFQEAMVKETPGKFCFSVHILFKVRV